MEFVSRRSPVFATKGMVASSQPLASEIGLSILKKGGNAADAAVAVAAALNVTEPTCTGIGGDCFCLYYDAKEKRVKGLNGSGRCPALLSIDLLRSKYNITGTLPNFSPHTITVPGAAAGWEDTLNEFGTMSLAEVLHPAIELAECGYPVSPVTAYHWERGLAQLKNGPYGDEMLLNGRPPKVGEIIKLPYLAQTFRELSNYGKKGFYEGRIAKSIVEIVQSLGGVMTLEDLQAHTSTFDTPISVNYRGVDVWEIPPNGQGITALMALNILEGFDIASLKHNSPEYLHLLIESLRLSFADTRYYVADPTKCKVPIEQLLSKEYAAKRRSLIDTKKAIVDVSKGSPTNFSNTVYFCVVDGKGNACSFINSNYMGFGTGIIPKNCGFTLQNRGANFSLDPTHPNALEPGKRPYHTIIPGMATKDGELYCPFGVMGGFMQPQGHVLLNMIDFDMEPQKALDSSRFIIQDGTYNNGNSSIAFEDGIAPQTVQKLKEMGHVVEENIVTGSERALFGRGQIIRRNPQTGVLWAGSDPRADGLAIGWS